MRLLWGEAQSGVESQLAVQARLACSHAAVLALRLDAVRRRRLFQVRAPLTVANTPCTAPLLRPPRAATAYSDPAKSP